MNKILTAQLMCLLACLVGGAAMRVRPATAQQPSLEKAAAQLQSTVCTLRVQMAGSGASEAEGSDSAVSPTTPRVVVCSGVLLGQGRVVTSVALRGECTVRATLPGGEQAAARIRVVDEFSGLSLLEIDHQDLAGIPLATLPPRVGSWVMSGAGWGADQPVISFGIVSGVEIAVAGTTLPAVLRCDLRVAQTSSGAPVVNRNGQLLGVMVLADREGDQGGWTYAVPVAHVLRLMRSLDEARSESSVLVLRRRRPVVGMVLDGDGQRVVVSRVQEESPAAKAGIRKGDEVLATDDVKIRSVYQALRPVLRKQPGDCVTFLLVREGAG